MFCYKELINSSRKFNAISFNICEQTYNNRQLKILILVAHLHISNSRPQIALRQRINLCYPDLLKEAKFVSNRRELTNRQSVLRLQSTIAGDVWTGAFFNLERRECDRI